MRSTLISQSGWNPGCVRAATTVLAVAIAGLFLTATATAATRPTRASLPTVEVAQVVGRVPGPAQVPVAAIAARLGDQLAGNPLKIQIPTIGTDAPLDRLGLNADGTLEVPPFARAGWFQGRAKPGETGPAVIAAHVDSKTGPAVFFKLRLLKAGDTVTVVYDDRTTVDFVVQGSESFSKSEFPTQRVYGPTTTPELRLITCGGSFDRRTGSYLDNLVVWATAISRKETS